MTRLCLHPHPVPPPRPLLQASAEPNALKPLKNATSSRGIDRERHFLRRFSALKGLGALESFSHNSTAARHWATKSTGTVDSKLRNARTWSLRMGAASRIFFINVEPYQM
jgi:hypothetical protein